MLNYIELLLKRDAEKAETEEERKKLQGAIEKVKKFVAKINKMEVK